MNKVVSIGLVALTIVLGVTSRAFAGGTLPAPEIDGATISTGLGLLAASILVVRSRRRK